MRSDKMQQSRENPLSVITDYEHFKRHFTPAGDTSTTERQCLSNGFKFIPMVIESHSGGWGKEALQVIGDIAKSVSAVSPDDIEAASLRIAQRLSISLQRENARAILQRLVEPCDETPWHEEPAEVSLW